jgi:alpha-galactosidase
MTINVLKSLTVVVAGFVFFSLAADGQAKEKLKIFILAGQSNTVGHARGHTIATLYKAGKPGDKALTEMVFGKDAAIEKAFDEQLVRARKIDELSGGISMDKIKKMPDGPEKKALQAQVDKLLEEHKAYKQSVIDACTVSDRVYITSIADRNVKDGKLSVGYGADPLKIGTEYGFGLSMAEKFDGPILLIKTAWGGKSIMYDFRPPSATEFKSTKAYADAKTKAAAQKAKYDEAVKNFPETKKKYAADLAAYEAAMKTADEKKTKKLRKPKEPKMPRAPRPFAQDNAGHFWRLMVEHVNKVLASPGDYHPAYDAAAGYEVAGFAWFQGYNDQFSPEYRGNYADNMKLFINDIRKEVKNPKMPFIIGVLGTGMTKEKVDANEVSQGQRKAAQFPEFKGNVRAVESYTQYSHYSHKVFEKGWPAHYHEWDSVGSDRPYHYLGSGAFFVRLGNSFAENLVELMPAK